MAYKSSTLEAEAVDCCEFQASQGYIIKPCLGERKTEGVVGPNLVLYLRVNWHEGKGLWGDGGRC